jgi:hypothetical protein
MPTADLDAATILKAVDAAFSLDPHEFAARRRVASGVGGGRDGPLRPDRS